MPSEADSSDDDRKPKVDPSTNSIDQSLDAIENQLSSISVGQSEFDSDLDTKDSTSPNQVKLKELANGLLNGNSGADNSEELPRSNAVEDLSSSTVVWRNNSEEMEVPSSPSSSGYAAERGSSDTSSRDPGIEEVDGEILEIGNSDSFDGVLDSQVQWFPGKRHGNEVDTYLILLTTSSDTFHHLKDCRIRIEKVLLESNVLSEVQRSMVDGGMRVEDLPADHGSHSGAILPHLGQTEHTRESSERFAEAFKGVGSPAGLWHFMYQSIYLDQYVSSEFSSPVNIDNSRKGCYRAYQKLYESMHNKEIGPHRTQFRRDQNYVLLCWVTQYFELYAAFDPLADKALAIKSCNRVCQWIKNIENEIFLLGGFHGDSPHVMYSISF